MRYGSTYTYRTQPPVLAPKEILHKPGPLDADEWETIRQHTIDGQRMLDPVVVEAALVALKRDAPIEIPTTNGADAA